jgi:hypothetical protein
MPSTTLRWSGWCSAATTAAAVARTLRVGAGAGAGGGRNTTPIGDLRNFLMQGVALESEPVQTVLASGRPLSLHGCVYDLASGHLTTLG